MLGASAILLPTATRDMVLFVFFLGAAFLLGPDAVLNRQMEERQARHAAALPDVIDLLTITVEAGLGFDQALDRTSRRCPVR